MFEGGGGGGGRVAVYFLEAGGFLGFVDSTAAAGARGGPSSGSGGVGSSCYMDTSSPDPHLHVYEYFLFESVTGRFDAVSVLHTGLLVFAADSAVTVNGDMLLDQGGSCSLGGRSVLDVAGHLALSNRAALFVRGADTSGMVGGVWAGVGSEVWAGDVTLDATSVITATGTGYAGGYQASGLGPAGGNAGSSWANGGGHGGAGGRGDSSAAPPAATYGSAERPLTPGSGGGAGAYSALRGGAGGGAIRMVVWEHFQFDGAVMADGVSATPSSSYDGGGGAGGSIWIDAHSLSGTGRVSVAGGDGAYRGGGGGGGRAAVYTWTPTTWGRDQFAVDAGAGYTSAADGTGHQGRGTAWWWVAPKVTQYQVAAGQAQLHLEYLRDGWINTVERCQGLAGGQWQDVMSFTSHAATTNLTDVLDPGWGNAHYRVRAEGTLD